VADSKKPADELTYKLERLVPLELLPPPRWLIKDILPEGMITVLYRMPSSGKTFAALSMALCAGTETVEKWCGFRTKPCKVLTSQRMILAVRSYVRRPGRESTTLILSFAQRR
jgi:hypothetical protein